MPKKYSVDAPAGMKSCPDCRETKALEDFHRKSGSSDGRAPYCKPCQSARAKGYRPRYRAMASATNKRWREAHPEWVRAEIVRRRKHDPDRFKRRYRKHGELLKAQWRLYYAENRDRLTAYYQANKDHRREVARRHHQANRLAFNERWQRRKALMLGGAAVDPVNYIAIAARDGMVCGICGLAVDWPELSFDHIIPLSKRGPHVEWNIRVTHKVCNSRKGAKLKPGQLDLPI